MYPRRPLAVVFTTILVVIIGAATSISEEFQILHDQDLPGHDLRTPIEDPRLKGVTLDQCRAACLGESACRAFTFALPAGWCFLKDKPASPHAFAGAVSGIRSDDAQHGPVAPALKGAD